MTHAKVYALAEKYLIGGLMSLALENFKTQASRDWNSNSFVEVAQAAYEITVQSDTGLRDVVVKTLAEHPSLLDKAITKNLLINTSCLAYDLLVYIRRSGGFKETTVADKRRFRRRS